MGMHEDLDDAAKQALRHMIDWITELTPLAARMPTACAASRPICASPRLVDGNKGIHCMLPKAMLET